MKHNRAWILVVALALVAASGANAPADETPDKEDRAPGSAETPPWSEPTAPPVGQSGSDPLPPPRIVRRGSGAGPAADPRPRIKDVVDAPAPSQPTAPAQPATPAQPASPPDGPAAPSGVAPIRKSPNEIHTIGKTHNLQHGGAGDLALQLDIQYELHGQAGRDVYVGIWFARVDTGEYLESTMAEYADPEKHATVQTRAARVQSNSARFAAALRVPYRVFPVKPGGDEYEVEARVEILRREQTGKVTVLCMGTTTFRVYGEPEEADAPVATKEEGAFPEPAARDEDAGKDAPADGGGKPAGKKGDEGKDADGDA